MRKYIAIILALIFVLSFAGCGQNKEHPAPQADNTATENKPDPIPEEDTPAPVPSPLRADTAYYSLTVPEAWENQWLYEENENALKVIHKASHDAGLGGRLFSICLIPEGEDYSFYPSYELLGNLKTENGSFHVVVTYPTDVQFTAETAQQYNDMSTSIPDILSAIVFKENCTFSTP